MAPNLSHNQGAAHGATVYCTQSISQSEAEIGAQSISQP